jgi:hypothetical protein
LLSCRGSIDITYGFVITVKGNSTKCHFSNLRKNGYNEFFLLFLERRCTAGQKVRDGAEHQDGLDETDDGSSTTAS